MIALVRGLNASTPPLRWLLATLGLVLSSVLLAAEPPVTAMSFTPSGESLLAASQAGVREYAWPALEPIREIQTPIENIRDLEFSPNGRQLAIAGGRPTEEGSIAIIDWPSGQVQHLLSAHEDSVTCVAWTSESQVASGSMDHQLFLWNAETGEQEANLRGHSKGVLALCVVPNTEMLVSAGIDRNLRVWDLSTLTLVRSLNNHTSTVTDLAASPVESRLPIIASASEDRSVRLWQPSIGRMVRFVRLDETPLQIGWKTDGSQLIATGSGGQLETINPTTIEVTNELPGVKGWAYSLCVHPTDGERRSRRTGWRDSTGHSAGEPLTDSPFRLEWPFRMALRSRQSRRFDDASN